MYFETSNINTPRQWFYKLRRRALAAAQTQSADAPFIVRRRPRAAGLRWSFNRRARSSPPAGNASGRHIRPSRSGGEVCVHQEILRSSAIGVVACLALVWLTGASHFGVVAAVVWGCCIGALIGILLCVGSIDAPEDPILPPSAEQARGKRSDEPRQRR